MQSCIFSQYKTKVDSGMWIRLFRNVHRGRTLRTVMAIGRSAEPSAGVLLRGVIDGVAATGT